MEQTNLMQSSSVETKPLMSPTQPTKETPKPTNQTETDEAKPKKPRKTLAERIKAKKDELRKLERMAEDGKRAALIRILYKNGIHTETELQAVLKKAGCVVTDEKK